MSIFFIIYIFKVMPSSKIFYRVGNHESKNTNKSLSNKSQSGPSKIVEDIEGP